MTKIDFTKKVLDLNEQPVLDNATKKEVTLGDCVVAGLMVSEEKEDYQYKARKFRLAQRVSMAREAIEVDLAEKDLIRDQVNKLYGPLVIGRTLEALYGSV